jgi:hypothetical protein
MAAAGGFQSFVPGPGPGIHEQRQKPSSVSWMAGPSPAMNGIRDDRPDR